MRAFVVVCVLALAFVVCGAVAANAADVQQGGQVSDQMLSAMGLGGMQPVSDAQGQQIRGKWFTKPSIVAVNFASLKIGKVEDGGRVYVSQRINIGRR